MKQIVFSFFIGDIEENLKEIIIEQLEIAFQILITKGYTVFVFSSEDKDIGLCKKFIDIFKDDHIQYISNTKENISLILDESQFSIVMDNKSLKYLLSSNKPFIALFNNKELLNELQLKNVFISMKEFNARILLDKIEFIEQSISNNDYNMKETMDLYKKQVKESIQVLIEQGLLKQANDIVQEYETIVRDDIDIYSIKGIIVMIEGNMDEAERVLKEGLLIDRNNFDLLYNLGYLNQLNGDNDLAIKYYKKALKNAKYQDAEDAIYKTLKELGVELSKEEILKSIFIEEKDLVELRGKLSVLVFHKKANEKLQEYLKNWYSNFGYTIMECLNINIDGEDKGIIVFYNLHPKSLTIEEQCSYPQYDDKNYFLINSLKSQLKLDFGITNIEKYFYYTKNEKEAVEIIESTSKELLKELNYRCKTMEYEYFSSPYKVIKTFESFKHRSRVELIEYKDKLAVKKTYKPGYERFLKRELYAYEILSRKCKVIPQLIEKGSNFIIIPYYENIIKDNNEKSEVLAQNILEISNFIKFIYDEGYAHLDFHPGNFIYSEESGLKAIDFEFLQEYTIRPTDIEQSYDIIGVPKSFQGDRPNYIGRGLIEYYNNLWIKSTGYSLMEIALLNNNSTIKNRNKKIDNNIKKVLTLINYTKTSGTVYNAQNFESAYHSIRIKDQYFRGQREPSERLKNVKYDFNDKVVLDIGCNMGGMLHALSYKIKLGIGVDYDYKLINAANSIKDINNFSNLQFYTFNLEDENVDLINNFILSDKVDICFLLAVCVWIRSWKEVITKASTLASNLLFESNGTNEQQSEQLNYLKNNYKVITLVNEHSFDDPRDKSRKLFLCQKSYNYIL